MNFDELGEDKSVTLTASSSDNGEISWSSSNTSVATVSEGKVTFLQPTSRTATVTITAHRGVASADCVITVTSLSIPEDYYLLTKETNANVVANPGVWYYHADGAEGSDYGFAKAPAYGNGGLSVDMDKFPSLADKKYYRFRYQPDFVDGTKYTVKFTLTVNIDGEVGVGTHSSYGGVTAYKVKADTAREVVYCGTVNSAEPFHINISKVAGTVSGNVTFKITDLVVKEYEAGDEILNEKLYDLVRGDASTTCKNAGKWYYMINPVGAGAADYTVASYDNGVITLTMAEALSGTDHQLRVRPDFVAGTKIVASFTVKLSTAGEIAYGLNDVIVREKIVFGGGDGEKTPDTEVNVTAVFTVSDTVPFVIWVTPAENAGAATMTVKDVSFTEKLPETFTVTYNSKGGSAVTAASVTEGGTVTEPNAPVYAAHKFDGWYLNEDYSGGKVSFPYTPEASVTFYAKWLNLYTVTFVTNGGSAMSPIENIVEGTGVTLTQPTREGFTFIGWYDSAEEGSRVSATYAPTANVTLYARWVENTVPTYTVTYDTRGGAEIVADVVTEGGSINLPAAPVYEGHIFDGWYESENYGGEKLSGEYTPSASVTLYAKWLEIYTVTYNSKDGSAVEKASVTEGNTVAEPETPVREGYVFDGWYAEENYSGEKITFPYTPSASINLYAKWLKKFTVTFNSNGGSKLDSVTAVDGSSITLPASTRNYYDFNGWYTDADLSGEALGETYSLSANVTLYAKWTLKAQYQMAVGSYGDVNANKNVWFYNNCTPSTAEYNNGNIGITVQDVKADAELRLRYLPDMAIGDKFTVHFEITVNANGKVKCGLDNMLGESNILSFTDYVKNNKVIAYYTGAVTKDGDNAQNKPFMILFKPTADGDVTISVKVLYVGVEKQIEKYSVTFESNGGSAVDTIGNILAGNEITLPSAPTRTGYVFDGWYDNELLEGDAIGAKLTVLSNVTLYAKWVEASTVTTYNVSFVTNGAAEIAAIDVISGNSLTLSAPVYAGHIFDGWYLNADFSDDKLGEEFIPERDVVLYAKWLGQYSVSFVVNHKGAVSINAQTVTEGSSIRLEQLSRKGFTFGGWYDNKQLAGEAVATEYVPAASVVLYAKWTVQTEYSLEQGDYGKVNKNRDAWYYNLQGSQASATVNTAAYNSGTVEFAVTGVKQQTSVGQNAVQLRYLPDLAGGKTYTAAVSITVTMNGIIKLAPDNKGQSQSITADTETQLTFTGEVEWNDQDKLYRPLLIQFYPAQDGDVTITVTNISITVPDPEIYDVQYGYNSDVRANFGSWYHYEIDAAKSSVTSAVYDHGTITVTLNNVVSTEYNFRYYPEAYVSDKIFNVSFRIKLSGGLKVSEGTISGTGITISEEDAEGYATITCTYAYDQNSTFEFRFKGSSAVGSSVTVIITDIEFTEAV